MSESELEAATRRLYRLQPDQFVGERAALAGRATDADLAAEIRRLRKPTVAAWVVNAHVASDPDVVATLTELGDELRHAQSELDHTRMRELVARRRVVVADATTAALGTAGRGEASATLRDEVSATFDAAVADPEIAAQLGLLRQPQRWSGFGFASNGAAGLSVVPDAAPEPERNDDRRRAVEDAQAALATAEEELDAAHAAEDDLTHRIRRMTTRLRTLQHDLDRAREDQTAARARTTEARKVRRRARSSLDGLDRRS